MGGWAHLILFLLLTTLTISSLMAKQKQVLAKDSTPGFNQASLLLLPFAIFDGTDQHFFLIRDCQLTTERFRSVYRGCTVRIFVSSASPSKSEGQELHPGIMLTRPSFIHGTHEEAQSSAACLHISPFTNILDPPTAYLICVFGHSALHIFLSPVFLPWSASFWLLTRGCAFLLVRMATLQAVALYMRNKALLSRFMNLITLQLTLSSRVCLMFFLTVTLGLRVLEKKSRTELRI